MLGTSKFPWWTALPLRRQGQSRRRASNYSVNARPAATPSVDSHRLALARRHDALSLLLSIAAATWCCTRRHDDSIPMATDKSKSNLHPRRLSHFGTRPLIMVGSFASPRGWPIRTPSRRQRSFLRKSQVRDPVSLILVKVGCQAKPQWLMPLVLCWLEAT
ncbi:hypothetical protein EV126DRAFT_405474 [Verticillium dahliae]|nr:hypothetical protein EV126DRAFT_405474 [Verticillium dahliae]